MSQSHQNRTQDQEASGLSAASMSGPQDAQDQLGNAALLEMAGLSGPGAESGGGNGCEPIEAEVRSKLSLVVRAMDAVMGQRFESLRRLEEDTEPQEIENRNLDVMLTLGALAVGTATAGFGGAIGLVVSASIANAVAKEFVKSAVKDLVDTALADLVVGAMNRHAQNWSEGGTADPRKAFFRGQADGITEATGPMGDALTGPGQVRAAMEMPDPVRTLQVLIDALNANKTWARDEQRQSSLVAWMNVLAQADCGTTRRGGVDLDGAEPGRRGPLYELFGPDVRGVLRLTVRGEDTDEPLSIQRIQIAGLNDDLAKELSTMKVTLGELGLSLYLEGEAFAHDPDFSGDLEFGGNSAGQTFVHGGASGRGWLQYYGMRERSPVSERGPGDAVEIIGAPQLANAGARRVLDEDLLDQPLNDIRDPATRKPVPVEHG